MNTIIAAVPYNWNLPTFYAESASEYFFKLQDAKGIDGDFEHELQFIDGTGSQALLDRVGVTKFFQITEQSDDVTIYAMDYVSVNKPEDILILEKSATDYAWEIAEMEGLKGLAMNYFNALAYGRDLKLGGELTEFNYQGTTYIILN